MAGRVAGGEEEGGQLEPWGAPPQPAGGTWAALFSEAVSLPGNVSGFRGSGGGVGLTAVMWGCSGQA